MPSSRAKWLRSAWPRTREPWATSTSPSSTGLTSRSISDGQVLAVGVEGDDDLGARFDHQPVAGAQGGAAAAVGDVAGDQRRRARRRRRRCRRGSRRRRPATSVGDAADLGRHLVEDVADVLRLVVGGDEDRDLAAEALRQPGLAELLPGQPLERRRELARVARRLRERPQDQQEEDEDREHGEAEDAAAVALFEGEGGEQPVGRFRCRRRAPGRAPATSRIRTSTLRSERRRTIA